MKDDGYLNARQAAAYVGYEPTGGPTTGDKAMDAFYHFVRRHHVETHRRGRRLLFLRSDLDRAIGRCTDAQQQGKFDRMETLARQHARGEAPGGGRDNSVN